jgi:peptidoglycan/xylan/chitin deacetylase (PgdA/CDA1 family)
MRSAWYLLLYHNVSWEENPYLRGLDVTIPPDLLREHLAALARLGDLVSVGEGLQRLAAGGFRRPTFSVWFDDGFVGVRRYAAPILAEHGAPGALSVCSRFVTREELFWRAKLSYLHYLDDLQRFRSALGSQVVPPDARAKDHVLNHFSAAMVQLLDQVYRELTSEQERIDAFRLFDTAEGLAELCEQGWLLVNHTAAHYPVGEAAGRALFASQFDECESRLRTLFGGSSTCWVLPFDRERHRTPDVEDLMRQCGGNRYLGLVGNRCNGPTAGRARVLYRIGVPVCTGRELVRMLARISS